MILHKVINDITVDFSEYKDFPILSHVEIYRVPVPPQIQSWFDSVGLVARDSELFVTPPGEHTGAFLHVDCEDLGRDVPKINWVHGGGEMIWMQQKHNNIRTIQMQTTYGNGYARVAKSSCIELDRAVLKNESTLVQTGVPHMIDYTGDVPRYCLSLSLLLDGVRPTIEQVVELLDKNK